MQSTPDEEQMMEAVLDGDLAAVQALLGRDRALLHCKDWVRCRTARAGPSSALLWVRRIWRALSEIARSEDQAASAP